MEKLLVSLEELTSLRGIEKMQEIYIVVLGYDLSGSSNGIAYDDGIDFLPKNANLKKWVYGFASPIFKIRRKNKHVWPGGLPLFYGEPGDITSIYLAILECDQGSRKAGEKVAALREAMSNKGSNPLIEVALKLSKVASPQIALIQEAFSFTIKGIETALLKNKDDLRYTNVFTFKKSDNYLVGRHDDWGDHRIELTIDVEL